MIEQILIGLCGVGSTWLSQDKRRNYQRWACILGLIAQPAWFYATWKAQQWGIFGLAFIYTYCWARGVWNYWLTPAAPWLDPARVAVDPKPTPIKRKFAAHGGAKE